MTVSAICLIIGFALGTILGILVSKLRKNETFGTLYVTRSDYEGTELYLVLDDSPDHIAEKSQVMFNVARK